jgi:hypothetical protein
VQSIVIDNLKHVQKKINYLDSFEDTIVDYLIFISAWKIDIYLHMIKENQFEYLTDVVLPIVKEVLYQPNLCPEIEDTSIINTNQNLIPIKLHYSSSLSIIILYHQLL